MTRPLRIEYPGALYHITACGNRREDIFINNHDREKWLKLYGKTCKRYNWVCHGFCLMTNHYHLIVETVDGGLSRGMRQLNGVYTQMFNRSHNSVGHLFQGRYKSILVDLDNNLLQLSRYVVLNPVRAGIVDDVADWPWSSFQAAAGMSSPPKWLETDLLLAYFHINKNMAQIRYQEHVRACIGCESPLSKIHNQVFLGDEHFVTSHLAKYEPSGDIKEVPQEHRRAARKPLDYFVKICGHSKQAMAVAYLSGHYTMKEIGDFFGVHYSTVSRAVKSIDG